MLENNHMALLTNLGSVRERGTKTSALIKKENLPVNTSITYLLTQLIHLNTTLPLVIAGIS